MIALRHLHVLANLCKPQKTLSNDHMVYKIQCVNAFPQDYGMAYLLHVYSTVVPTIVYVWNTVLTYIRLFENIFIYFKMSSN